MYINRDKETLYGCNQDWYLIEWRRRAGCGPVAATNILLYLRKKYGVGKIPYENGSVNEVLDAMNDVYLFVRPKRHGLHTVRKFVKGMCNFGRKYGLSFLYRYIIVPPQEEKRPGLDKIVRFIEEGLSNDVPIAFLNLDAGDVEEQLSSWHWVTVVGMSRGDSAGSGAPALGLPAHGLPAPGAPAPDESEPSGAERPEAIILRYFDQSKNLEVDLGKWLSTTAGGGGFAYFCKPSPRTAPGDRIII